MEEDCHRYANYANHKAFPTTTHILQHVLFLSTHNQQQSVIQPSEKFENTKRATEAVTGNAIYIRKKDKMTNNGRQNTTQKTKD